MGLILGGALLLPACTDIHQSTQMVTQGAAKNYELLKKDVKDMLTYKLPDDTPKPVPPTYCYRVMQDIVCYHKPVAGGEGRLVAYQGNVEEQPEAVKQASAAVAVQDVPHQAEAAPVAPVDATASVQPSTPSPMAEVAKMAAASDGAPKGPTPLTLTEDQKAKAQQSMQHFDSQPPVAVGAEPSVKSDTAAH